MKRIGQYNNKYQKNLTNPIRLTHEFNSDYQLIHRNL